MAFHCRCSVKCPTLWWISLIHWTESERVTSSQALENATVTIRPSLFLCSNNNKKATIKSYLALVWPYAWLFLNWLIRICTYICVHVLFLSNRAAVLYLLLQNFVFLHLGCLLPVLWPPCKRGVHNLLLISRLWSREIPFYFSSADEVVWWKVIH